MTRATASLIYHRRLPQGTWASTVVWGRNSEESHATHAFLAESTLNMREQNVFFARAELVEKPGEDLVIEDDVLEERTFSLGKVQVLPHVLKYRERNQGNDCRQAICSHPRFRRHERKSVRLAWS